MHDLQEWEFFIAGSPFAQLHTALGYSASGEVVVSKKAWGRVSAFCEGVPVPNCASGTVAPAITPPHVLLCDGRF
jgi:hypothetical protein